ncbi:MAG: hypothetical protein PHP03_02840 [Candidatus Pacebacteria bacterium]|nr:hypothetical protein [Candidatus Paceibacterota bacterium]
MKVLMVVVATMLFVSPFTSAVSAEVKSPDSMSDEELTKAISLLKADCLEIELGIKATNDLIAICKKEMLKKGISSKEKQALKDIIAYCELSGPQLELKLQAWKADLAFYEAIKESSEFVKSMSECTETVMEGLEIIKESQRLRY